jgi:hypothetical protein
MIKRIDLVDPRERRSRILRIAASFAILLSTIACTVIRDDDPDETDGGGGPPVVVEPDPAIVDLLVMVDLDPSATNLASSHAQIVGALGAALSAAGVQVRRSAVAPLHERVGATVPLLGSGEELGALVQRYSTGDGAAFLSDGADDDYANLLALGGALADAPLYSSEGLPDSGQAYFEPPADGWVVVVLGALSARCGSAGCETAAVEVATALTATNEVGDAAWLDLPGDEGLTPSRIVYVLITPPEVGDSYAALADACRARPNFPTAVLDFMAPSPPFHSQVAEEIVAAGGRARWLDFCAALSSQGEATTADAAATIATAVRGG